MDKVESKIQVFHRPDWHPRLSPLLGNLKGQYAYVTDVGTINIIGPLYEDPDISKFQFESKIEGPVESLSAKKGLGIL